MIVLLVLLLPLPPPLVLVSARRSGSLCSWGGASAAVSVAAAIRDRSVTARRSGSLRGWGGASSPLLPPLIIMFITVFIGYFLLGAARLRRCCCR